LGGARGGGNFGVVTTFEFTAHPLGPVVPVAVVMYPVDNASELFRAWQAWASSATDEAMSRAIFWWMPEDPLLPPAVHNRQVFIVGAIYTGSPDKGQQVLQPLRELGTPLLDLGAEMPLPDVPGRVRRLLSQGAAGQLPEVGLPQRADR
jgi:FAD/FMN-containing dehydrogenase